MLDFELLYFDKENQKLCIDLIPEHHVEVTLDQIKELLVRSPYRQFAFLEHEVMKALQLLKRQAGGANKGQTQRIPIAEQVDGSCSLKLSTDKMQVEAIITAPQGGKRSGFSELVEQLQQLSINNGLLKNNIQQLLDAAKAIQDGKEIKAVIAKGRPPQHGRNAQLERLVKLNRERLLQPKILENGKVDMRDLGEIPMVHAGDEVLRRHDPEPGLDGYNVIGEVLKAKAGKDKKLKVGKGTETSKHDPNLLLASIDGQPKETKSGIDIVEVLTLQDVNVGTGHINYHGNVIVQGNVEEDMKVHAEGDITVNGFVDNAELRAGGDIVVAKGVIGRQKTDASLSTKLHADGEIHLSFAQYAQISAKGNIDIQTQLIHCQVVCGQDLKVGIDGGKKGDLVGGHVQVQGALTALNIGARAATQSHLKVGLGIAKLRQDAKEYHQKTQDLLKQSYNLRTAISRVPTMADKTEQQREALVKQFKTAQEQNSAKLSEAQLLLAETEQQIEHYFEHVCVKALHSLFPQVHIEMGTQSLTTEREFGPSKVSAENGISVTALEAGES
ncbi:DUF342 domain-containing protein [Ferrimonas aestuarii]|uniref:DUF342 domain-containing protein n=1 Tax=Ferrimonas aestuarii TaxID=2569539 RepID=A0A4V5NVW9_9GAMM|nr:FapA family protein [Ferrimonas aestuarii]TKB53040.1 DUF342 domain-containing protein [Ferrimonas aestuarii]